jgi:hypothetical protein
MRHPRNDSQRARPATDLAPVVRGAEHALLTVLSALWRMLRSRHALIMRPEP